MHPIVEKLSLIGIVPVVRIDGPEDAVPLAKALCNGGLPCAEVTFRTAAAEEAIRAMAQACPEMLVGAGTVLTTEQADRAVEAGARFIVSPGLNPKVVRHCLERGIPITPGTSNASDIEVALELGLDAVKFFPAEASGGLKAIKALAAPYVNMKFMPTGGINAKNLNEYLAFPKVIACGGSWMVDPALVAAGDFDAVTRLTDEAVQLMLGFEVAHVGVNAQDGEEGAALAAQFAALLGLPHKKGNSSDFAGSLVEVMKGGGRGKNGHVGIRTNSIRRACHYFSRRGYDLDDFSYKTDARGNPVSVYLQQEIGGFAIHLLQK